MRIAKIWSFISIAWARSLLAIGFASLAAFLVAPRVYAEPCSRYSAKGASAAVCENLIETSECRQLAEENPDLVPFIRKCDGSDSSDEKSVPKNIGAAIGSCRNGAWESFSEDVQFLLSILTPNTKATDEQLARLDFFRDCTTAECRRDMLGPYAELFTKEELEGTAEARAKLNCKDEAAKNACYGFSSATLYRLLGERVQEKIRNRTVSGDWIVPWTGEVTNLEKSNVSLMEIIAAELGELGVKIQCFNAAKRSELFCYGLAMMVTPVKFRVADEIKDIMRLRGSAKKLGGRILARTKACVGGECFTAKLTESGAAHIARRHLSSKGDIEVINRLKTKMGRPLGSGPDLDWVKKHIGKIEHPAPEVKVTTVFEGRISAQDIADQLTRGKASTFQKLDGASRSPDRSVFSGRVQLEGPPKGTYEMDMVVCRAATGGCHQRELSADGFIVREYENGEIMTMYPTCGPGVMVLRWTKKTNTYEVAPGGC